MKYLKYILISLVIIVPCIITVLIYNDKITQNSPQYYKQGVEFYDKGDYQNAYYNFSQIKWISPLYPMAVYKQAKSAQLAGDYRTAAIKYKIFLEKLPDTVFDLKAKLNLGKSYFYLKQYEEAKVPFLELADKTDNDGTEEVYFLGLIEKNFDKEKAADYFRRYLDTALKGEALNNNYITASAVELSSLGINLTDTDYKLIGIAYFKNKQYSEALNYLSKLPTGDSWDYLVLANHYSGHKTITKKLIETGLTFYAESANEDNLHEIYNVYSSYLYGNKLKSWEQIYKLVTDNSLKGTDYILYKLAECSSHEKAIEYYNAITSQYPDSNYAPESMWEMIWNAYKKQDYKTAELMAIQHLKTFKNAKSTPKVAFWLAKIALKQNKVSEAHSYFSKLISRYPDNYYGLRAESIINKKDDFWTTNIANSIPEQKEQIEFPISLSQIEIKDLKVINTLFDMGDYEIFKDADYSSPIVESWFEYKNNKKSRSIVLARDEIEKMEVKPSFLSAAYKLAYPRYWISEINIAGQKLNIDPYLVAAIIREESYYNEHAKSRTGATGLMQLMPLTANYMISKLSDNVNEFADLEDPRTNLYLGCNYVKYLKDRFDNDLMVVAAYNGGEGSVNKWMRTYSTEDLDEFVENIPFEETRNYVKKVFRSYHMYQKIYK
ncbi:transglycosylase SLT domain-containing protein [bacterium]|nr:transglycosylase SLT domain-containing protein [bacterium]